MDLTNLVREPQNYDPDTSDIIYALGLLIEYVEGMQKGHYPAGDRSDEFDVCEHVLDFLFKEYTT
jgi:hypothetical protein